MVLSCAAENSYEPMRLAGTWKQYSKKAMPQLAKMTFQSPSLRYLRWPYHAKVMKMLEIVSNKIVRIFRGASFLVAAWMPGFGAKIAFEISMASLAYRV